MNSQQLGGMVLFPLGNSQRMSDCLSFSTVHDFFEHEDLRERHPLRRAVEMRRNVESKNGLTLQRRNYPFQDIGKLAHVSRPIIISKYRFSLLVNLYFPTRCFF